MNEKIETILNDLYRLDPSFRSYEKELRGMVAELLSSRPDSKFDAVFAERLKKELQTALPKPVLSPLSGTFGDFVHVLQKNARMWAPTAIILILLPFSFVGMRQLARESSDTGFTLNQKIDDKGIEAFGTIPVPTVARTSRVTYLSEIGARTETRTAPDAVTVTSLNAPVVPADSPASMKSSLMAVPEDQTTATITYEYTGGPFEIKDAKGKVYKQKTQSGGEEDLTELVKNLNFKVVDLSEFKNVRPEHIELAEDGELAHTISINFREGIIAINPDWQKWASTTNDMSLYPIPDDAVLVAISNTFLKDYGIDTSIYLEPVVMHEGGNGAGVKVPAGTMISILYPITIDGLAVYDESGMSYGFQVLVNVKEQKVASVSNLYSQKYESALYDLITDSGQVVHMATSSGARGVARTVVELGKPERILMKSGDVYVPALLFKATIAGTGAPADPVIVPIIKEKVVGQ